jgi:glycosyltransferase involved in cell wall biosynthesis
MKISYLITCHNEDTSLNKCITSIVRHKDDDDEIIILDDFSDNPKTKLILEEWGKTKNHNIRLFRHPLNKNYGAHKNYGNDQATGDWIFQVDGDEIPNPTLVLNLKDIILANPNVELIFVPRINDFIGVTEEDSKQWGWKLTKCPACENRLIVNWPDYQSRIYKRVPERIRWDRRLHERIEGHTGFAALPEETDFSLYHDKTIETQRKTNERYNQWFTEDENRGHNVFDRK